MKFKLISLLLVSALLIFKNVAIAQTMHKPALEFTLSDVNGNKVSLSDFKGKVVYLDFWASWCGTCMYELPFSKALSEKFNGDTNIAFVYISIDQDAQKWQKIVKKKKMLGTQLISQQGKESNVLVNYEVASIPRFIIIDRNGMIIDYNAKMPDEADLESYLRTLLLQ